MAERPGNQTPNTPDVDESDLRGMKVDELREEARDADVAGASDMRKEELVQAVARERSTGGDAGGADAGPGPDGGRVRTGPDTSDSLQYSQEVTSPDDDPERPGRSLVTTHHDVIREWAEARGGTPATVPGSEHDGHLGVLRIDFPGYGGDSLEHVSWDKWFEAFDARRLNFFYQEERTDGNQSNFFRLENPDREDA